MSIQLALWRCVVNEGGKLENRQISRQNAPDCTKLRLKFQKFPGGNTPEPPILGKGTPPPQTPSPPSRDLCSLTIPRRDKQTDKDAVQTR